MVTKLMQMPLLRAYRYILAKNHMVTKQITYNFAMLQCYILAKNHMVTKPGRT